MESKVKYQVGVGIPESVVAIDGHKYNVSELMVINDADLINEFACQAARFAYFAVKSAEAEYGYAMATQFRKETEAEAFSEFKADTSFAPAGSKSVTDGFARELVELDEKYVEARQAEYDALLAMKTARAIADAFQMRADMLKEIGRHRLQEEVMTNMSVRKPSSERDSEEMRNALKRRAGS